MSKVRIMHNVERDENTRFVGMLNGYQPGHDMLEVFVYDVDDVDYHPEHAFEIFNQDVDWLDGRDRELAKAYRDKNLRSLSVGDVVVVDDVAHAVEHSGWKKVTL